MNNYQSELNSFFTISLYSVGIIACTNFVQKIFINFIIFVYIFTKIYRIVIKITELRPFISFKIITFCKNYKYQNNENNIIFSAYYKVLIHTMYHSIFMLKLMNLLFLVHLQYQNQHINSK